MSSNEQGLSVRDVGGAQLTQWGGAAQRGLEARREREQIIKQVLVQGDDFGVIPGTDKPTLLKSGGEKIADSLGLYPDYEQLALTEDFDRPLFFYRYKCLLRHRGSDAVIATGIGSCNSMESRYRYRNAGRNCPKCGKETIIKGKAEYGGGWLCFSKKGGCGAKFDEGDVSITSQTPGRVENEDIFSLTNTVDKMAQKRAMIAATLNLGFSSHFTQDLEDQDRDADEAPAGKPKVQQPKRASENKSAAAAPAANGVNKWQGLLASCVEKKRGEGPKGPYVLYEVTGADGTKFQTFSDTTADVANTFIREKAEALIRFEKGQYGNKIADIEDAVVVEQ